MGNNEMTYELTILMPCLNEAETLGTCIKKAREFIELNNISGEILIADNGSTDNSLLIAVEEGARSIHVQSKGYGSTLIAGIHAAKGRYIIMGDADDSYDFLHLENFMIKLRQGNDFVMGNRFAGGIRQGAMPFLHRYLGNPVLSFTGRIFFRSSIRDFHCGLRGFNTEKIKKLGLVTTGMEFASEMVVKASIAGYSIAEVPAILYKDGRTRPPHLHTWRDGWRHLVFLLMFSPKWLFLVPSILIFVVSLVIVLLLLPGTFHIKHVGLDVHSLTVAGTMIVLSYQLFLFALFVRFFSIHQGLYPAKSKHQLFHKLFTLERGITIGAALLFSGLIIFGILFIQWKNLDFGPMNDISSTFRLLIPSITLISLGIQTIFSSFLLRILSITPKTPISNESS